jgi:porin
MRFDRIARGARALMVAIVLIATLPLARATDTTQTSRETAAVQFGAQYIGEAWQTGGVPERRSAWLDLIETSLTIDGARTFGVDGVTVKVAAQRNSGRAITDAIGATAPLSSIEALAAARISEAWVEWAATNQRGSIKAGVMDLNDEFDSSEVGGLFVNSTFGLATDVAQSGLTGPPTYPTGALGIRAQLQRDDYRLQAAFFDGVPGDPRDPIRPTLRWAANDGTLAVVEVGHDAAPTRWYLGAWRYSTALEPVRAAIDPTLAPARGSSGAYALVERTWWTNEVGSQLQTSLRIGRAAEKFNAIRDTVQFALRLDRPWQTDGESLGFAWSIQRHGDPSRSVASALGDNLVEHESVLEFTYRRPLGARLVLQPDLQYFAQGWAVGLRFELDLSP